MKILVPHPRISYCTGGGEKYPMDSIYFMAKRNPEMEFIIFTTAQGGQASKIYLEFKTNTSQLANVKVIELSIPEKFSYLYDIYPGKDRFRWDIESFYFGNLVLNYIIKNKIIPDVIWSYYLPDFPFKLEGIKTVLNLLGYPKNKTEYREALMFQYDLIVSINVNTVNKWNEVLDIKTNNYKILKLGINKEAEKQKETINKISNSFNVLFAGRLLERKGVLGLCEVVRKISIDHPSIVLHICGEGLLEEQIKMFIKDNKLDKNIILYGFIKNINSFYMEVDVCVFPSNTGEGQMSTVLEAMYFNGNVITTTQNGNEEYIQNGKNGFLFDSKDWDKLENILRDQINNKVNIANIKQNAKAIVKNNTWEEYENNYKEICKTLINTNPIK